MPSRLAPAKPGSDLEKRVGAEAAGILIYLKSTPNAPVPNFYASDEDAMKDIRERAAKQTQMGNN